MSNKRRQALTLLELIVVLVILVAMAAMVVPLVSNSSEDSREKTTRVSMARIRDAIQNRYWPDMIAVNQKVLGFASGYPYPLEDNSRQPHPQLYFLFIAPNNSITSEMTALGIGWRGPYLQHNGATYPDTNDKDVLKRGFNADYGRHGDPTVMDGWGNPIILQIPSAIRARLISAGSDGTIQTLESSASEDLNDIAVYFQPQAVP